MKSLLFSARVRQPSEALPVTTIDLQGEINANAEEALDRAYAEAEAVVPITEGKQAGSTTILLNFSQVDYINSTGIALIVGLLARARKTHRKLVVCGLSDHYREIFQITRLSDFMSIYDSEEELFGAFTS